MNDIEQETVNFKKCIAIATKNGHSEKKAMECDDGSVGCPDCPFGSVKEKYNKQEFDEIKCRMVKLIESRGLPVGFVRKEHTETFYGIRVNADRTITTVGDAIKVKDLLKTIDNLCFADLAYLLHDQYVKRGKLLQYLFDFYGMKTSM